MTLAFQTPTRRLARGRSIRAAALVLLSGCTTLTPVTFSSAPPTQPLRLRLTADGTRRVEPAFGPYIVALDAVREAGTGDTVVLRVSRTYHQAGLDESRQGAVVRLAVSDIESAQARRTSRGRTIGVIAAIVGAAVLIPSLFGGALGGSPSGGPTPTPP